MFTFTPLQIPGLDRFPRPMPVDPGIPQIPVPGLPAPDPQPAPPPPFGYRRSGIRGALASIGDFFRRDPNAALGAGRLAGAQGTAEVGRDVGNVVLGENTPLYEPELPPAPPPTPRPPVQGQGQGQGAPAGQNAAVEKARHNEITFLGGDLSGRGPLDPITELLTRKPPPAPGLGTADRPFTNADLDRIRVEGPSRGGFGTFSTPDTEQEAKLRELEDLGIEAAMAQARAATADPSGMGMLQKRLQLQQEYDRSFRGQTQDQVNEALAEYNVRRAQIMQAQGRSLEEKQAALSALDQDFDRVMSAINPGSSGYRAPGLFR